MAASDKQFHVYVLASLSRKLYVGMTTRLGERMQQHKQKQMPGFTARYNIDRLVYVEEAPDARSATARERQLKGWTRAKKLALIESVNPGWADLAESWFATYPAAVVLSQAVHSSGEDPSLRSG